MEVPKIYWPWMPNGLTTTLIGKFYSGIMDLENFVEKVTYFYVIWLYKLNNFFVKLTNNLKTNLKIISHSACLSTSSITSLPFLIFLGMT